MINIKISLDEVIIECTDEHEFAELGFDSNINSVVNNAFKELKKSTLKMLGEE